jgi:hypothetical protein
MLSALAKDRIGVIEAFHQSIVRAENGCFLPGPGHPQDRFERMPCGRVAKAEITMANGQKIARFQTAFEIGDGPRKNFETQERIAPRDTRPTETAMPKHRHAEDGVIGRRRLPVGRFCGRERNGGRVLAANAACTQRYCPN